MNDPELQQALRTAIDGAASPVGASEARHRSGTRRTRLPRGRLSLSLLGRLLLGRPPARQGPGDRAPRDEHASVWLDDDEPSTGRPDRVRRPAVAVIAAVVCVAVVGIPLGLVLTSAGSSTPSGTKLGTSKAKERVLSALSATIASGSFDISYDEKSVTSPTSSTPTTNPCTGAQVSGGISGGARITPGTGAGGSSGSTAGGSTASTLLCASSGSALQGLPFAGQGTIDTSPFAMVASTNVPQVGPVTLRDDGTDVWEIGGGNYGLSPGSSDTGPGSPLSGFSGLVEGTLGPRQGGLAMMGLASPTGYLELDQNAVTSASQVGTGVVDGVAVTIYQVSLDPAQEANVPGTTSEEATAIRDALTLLQHEGYTGTSVKVSIDDAGYIRETVSVASFTDGATQTTDVTFSNFGCAGKVLMPGQQGATAPPAGCVSPDTSSSSTVTPTTVNQTTATT